MDDELDLDNWGDFNAKPKLLGFSTTRDTQADRENDSEEEEDADDNGVRTHESALSERGEPQFMLEDMGSRLEFLMNKQFSSIVACGGVVFFVTTMNTVFVYDADDESYRPFNVPCKPSERIHKIFVDPLHCHVLITVVGEKYNSDIYYFNTTKNKNPKVQPKLKDMLIESVGWDKNNNDPNKSGAIIVGCRDGNLYELRIEGELADAVKSVRPLFDLKEDEHDNNISSSVLGIEVESLSNSISTSFRGTSKYYIMIVTPFRLYEFVGGSTFEELFNQYHHNVPLNYKELPFNTSKRDYSNTELHFYRDSMNSPPKSFAWLSNSGIFHGKLNFSLFSSGRSALSAFEVISFEGSKNGIPSSLALTEYHTILAFKDRIQVLMQPAGLCGGGEIDISDLRVAFEEEIDYKMHGSVLCLNRDIGKEMANDIFVCCERTVYCVFVDDEERDVWKLYLERALEDSNTDDSSFDTALQLCKGDTKSRDIILTAKAEYLFKRKRYPEAALLFAKTTKSFEEICILFHNHQQETALRSYLASKLKLMAEKDKSNTIQLSCLCTWLTEMYLVGLNKLQEEIALAFEDYKEQSRKREAFQKLQSEFRQFMEEHKNNLNKETTFRLITSHGVATEVLYYALLMEDYERVISHCITEGDFVQALDILNKFCRVKHEEYFYKFTPVLMQHLPTETVNMLTQKRFLESSKLIPALMRYITTFKPKANQENPVIRYLEWCIQKQKNEDPAIHNLLLSLYAKETGPTLLNFLNTDHPESNFYDRKYALRVCMENKRTEACIRLYSMMNMFEDAVMLALSVNDTELARECADKPNDDDDKKKLWLRIAQHVINSNSKESKEASIKNAITFLRQTDKIKLEDILPFFPDFTLIDDFKDEICKSLEEYKTEIDDLKKNMQEATEHANYIRHEIKDLKHRHTIITTLEKCDGPGCHQPILNSDFYLFSCGHTFHSNCLYNEVLASVPESKKKRMIELFEKKKGDKPKEPAAANWSLFGGDTTQPQPDAQQLQTTLQDEMREYDELIAAECPYCGDMIISTIDIGFTGDEEAEGWDIGTTSTDIEL